MNYKGEPTVPCSLLINVESKIFKKFCMIYNKISLNQISLIDSDFYIFELKRTQVINKSNTCKALLSTNEINSIKPITMNHLFCRWNNVLLLQFSCRVVTLNIKMWKSHNINKKNCLHNRQHCFPFVLI